VVGVIEDRSADFYRVNIFSGSAALLPRTDFDGATKRNKPELRRGDTVYCRIVSAEGGLDTSK
jgi:exosome complex component RRP40